MTRRYKGQYDPARHSRGAPARRYKIHDDPPAPASQVLWAQGFRAVKGWNVQTRECIARPFARIWNYFGPVVTIYPEGGGRIKAGGRYQDKREAVHGARELVARHTAGRNMEVWS